VVFHAAFSLAAGPKGQVGIAGNDPIPKRFIPPGEQSTIPEIVEDCMRAALRVLQHFIDLEIRRLGTVTTAELCSVLAAQQPSPNSVSGDAAVESLYITM
jgi:hypothetical protein